MGKRESCYIKRFYELGDFNSLDQVILKLDRWESMKKHKLPWETCDEVYVNFAKPPYKMSEELKS